jgi:hypothetical protein
MNDTGKQALSVLEKNTAEQALELFRELEADQVERVWAHVQERLTAAQVSVHYDEQVNFARTPVSPFGKLTCVAKTKLDEVTFDSFLRFCATHQTDIATMLRDCVYQLVYGKTCDQMLVDRIKHATQPTEALTKQKGPFGGPESNGSDGEP